MSPKSNRSGISYGENDPRGLPMPGGVRVTRARDMEAAIAGLPTDDEVEQANKAAIEEYLAGDEMNDSSVNDVPRDYTREGVPQGDYDDANLWSYPDLQQECRERQLDGALNVSREDLVARLREDDAKRDTAPPTGD